MQDREKLKQNLTAQRLTMIMTTIGGMLPLLTDSCSAQVSAQETFILKVEGPGMTTPALIMPRIATRC